MSWIVLALFGGIVGLDATSFPQAMISRPLIAATLAGALMGEPLAGLAVGAMLEILALVILPFGASRYPESGTAAAAAAAGLAASGLDPTALGPLLVALIFALSWEQVAGASVIFTRRINERLVAVTLDVALTDRQIERRHLLAMAIDFMRGAWAVALGTAVASLLLQAFGPMLSLPSALVAGALAVAACAMVGATLNIFGGWRERKLSLGLGLVCGLVLMLLRS